MAFIFYRTAINLFIKRWIGIILAIILILLLWPFYLIIAAAVAIEDGFPVFYRPQRGGYKNKPFRIFKFRTMVKNADKIGGGTTALNDPRITKVGNFLRKTKLDETPQLFNIIVGTMSFIGPRPELLRYTGQYEGEEKLILEVRPGITDFSSIEFINLDEIVGAGNVDEMYEKYVLKKKNQLRIKYAKEVSFTTDITLFAKTVWRVVEKALSFIYAMKRILYLGGFELPDKNAAAQRVLSNAKLLREMGLGVTFMGISKDIQNAPTEVEGFKSVPVPYPTSIGQWIHQICTFVNSNGIVAQEPEYVVLYNFPAIASLKILKACHKNGIKVIHDLTEWESNSGWSPSDIMRRIDIALRMRYCMKRMDGVIAISRYLYDFYKNDVKTILVPPTVDLDDPKWSRDEELDACSPVTLVYAGSPGGGVKDRLDLIVDEIREFPNINLNVVGVTAEQFFNAFGRKQEKIPNVSFRGRLSHKEAVRSVCDADFQMLIRNHSRKNDAGFPTKLAESMACRTPVIATVFSNITDYASDGMNAFLVDESHSLHDVFEMVSKLSKEDIIAMKQRCMDMRDFDYRQYKSEFEKIFQ